MPHPNTFHDEEVNQSQKDASQNPSGKRAKLVIYEEPEPTGDKETDEFRRKSAWLAAHGL